MRLYKVNQIRFKEITFFSVAISVPLLLLHLNRIIKSLLKPVPDPRDRPTISNLRVSGSSHHQLPSYSIAFIKALRIDDVSTVYTT